VTHLGWKAAKYDTIRQAESGRFPNRPINVVVVIFKYDDDDNNRGMTKRDGRL